MGTYNLPERGCKLSEDMNDIATRFGYDLAVDNYGCFMLYTNVRDDANAWMLAEGTGWDVEYDNDGMMVVYTNVNAETDSATVYTL